MKRTSPLLAVLILLLFLLLGLGAATVVLLSPAPGLPAEGRLFELRRGESTSTLALRLEKEGLIRSSTLFTLAARLEGKAGRLRSGSYRISAGMGSLAILDLFVSGREALQRLTLPEGLSLRETAALLEKAGIAKAPDFEAAARDPALLAELGIAADSAEGYLYPDTYLMPANFGAAPALRQLISTFRGRLASIPEAAGLDARALQDKVILASIIEREYRIPEEAPLIASVFANRLRIGMALQSCATVVYVITERQGKPHPDVVYDRDLRIQDPFNTYLHRGLPPAPISSPGLVALRAAFEPARTKWLYFRLVDADTGAHHFSSTFDEHLRAAQLVLRRTGGQ